MLEAVLLMLANIRNTLIQALMLLEWLYNVLQYPHRLPKCMYQYPCRCSRGCRR